MNIRMNDSGALGYIWWENNGIRQNEYSRWPAIVDLVMFTYAQKVGKVIARMSKIHDVRIKHIFRYKTFSI